MNLDQEKTENKTKQSTTLSPLKTSIISTLKKHKILSGFVYDARLMSHDQLERSTDVHPENPIRIHLIFRMFQKCGLLDRLVRVRCREVADFEIEFYHTKRHVKFMKETENANRSRLKDLTKDGDSVYFNAMTNFCAKLSAGGVIELLKEIVLGNLRNGFAAVRPPGHHAVADEAMGFCFYNNVVIAVKKMQKQYGVKKVLILDWDVHHGNGIEDAFYNEPDVLYISLHRFGGGFYPLSGEVAFIGGDKNDEAKGRNINIPFTGEHMGDSDYLYAFQKVVMPIAHEFNPELVVVSAGFDAAEGDPIGEFKVTPKGYAHMTYMLKSLANGRLAICLEGGYNPEVIARSAVAVARVLLGDHPDEISIPTYKKLKLESGIKPSIYGVSESAKENIKQVIQTHANYWKCMKDLCELEKWKVYH